MAFEKVVDNQGFRVAMTIEATKLKTVGTQTVDSELEVAEQFLARLPPRR